MEIYRAIYDKWVPDDTPPRGHINHKEIGFYLSREKAERELYLYIAQRIRGIDKEKTKGLISLSNENRHVIINKDDHCWVESITVNA